MVIPVGGEIALVAISLSIVAIVPTIVAALVGDLFGKIMGYLTMFFLVMIVAPLTYLKVKSFGFWELLTLDLTASSCSLAILRISTSGLGFDVGSIVAISNLSFGVALLVAAIMGGWKSFKAALHSKIWFRLMMISGIGSVMAYWSYLAILDFIDWLHGRKADPRDLEAAEALLRGVRDCERLLKEVSG
ncbi:hypothetical protein [Methanopyrus sp. SNP6]|uniref:hypothetical protein n=1 Tax=Methanopyrus sp. SNP6 TaxID=1937005 RepID=UPI00143C6399|nr:hypothetical protein [Methanopyrus sp. SNP6]